MELFLTLFRSLSGQYPRESYEPFILQYMG